MRKLELGREINRAADPKENGTRRVVTVTERPTQRALDKMVVGTVVEPSDIIDTAATTARGITAIALRSRESKRLGKRSNGDTKEKKK